MAGLARRLAPAAALGGLALVIVGIADPALGGHDQGTDTGALAQGVAATAAASSETSTTTADTTTDTTPEAATDSTADTTTDSASATACDNPETATGDAVMTRWGPVQVSAAVADGQICSVHAIEWPTGDGKSQMINSYAIPQLDASASQLGIAFDYVSGATYTSDGYHQSLQSLLDAM